MQQQLHTLFCLDIIHFYEVLLITINKKSTNITIKFHFLGIQSEYCKKQFE